MDNLGNALGQAAMSTSSYLSSKIKPPDFSKARQYLNTTYQDTKSRFNDMKDNINNSEYLKSMQNSINNNEYLNNAYQNTKSKFNNMKERFSNSFSNYKNSMGGKIRTRRNKKSSSKYRRKNKSRRNRRRR
jgi:hypothetical protein